MTTVAPPVKERRHGCQSHCAACGQHFAGVTAFDAHRKGGYCNEPSEVLYGPDSKRPGQPVLQVWVADGSCDKMPGCWKDGKRVAYVESVTIWQMFMTDAQRESLAKLGQGALWA